MITLRNVSVAFGPRTILRQARARFERGQVHLVTGANGAGKSTLLKVISGLVRPSGGRVVWEEEASVGYLGHATFLYPALTARENLAFWQRAAGLPADERTVMAMLERVGLARHADTRAGVFSRGMQQRLNLARVLLAAPDALLLDEPGTGLDAPSRDLLDSEITAARGRGACVIWVSHDVERDRRLADAVLAIRGRALVTLAGKDTPAEPAADAAAKEGPAC